tara:strand:- start:186 stop:353 length:168 start_codon:yes stop_codon:yes gene_type:complete
MLRMVMIAIADKCRTSAAAIEVEFEGDPQGGESFSTMFSPLGSSHEPQDSSYLCV